MFIKSVLSLIIVLNCLIPFTVYQTNGISVDEKVSEGNFVIRTYTGHTSEVWSVKFSPDGSLLASASSDNSIIIWNTSSGEIMRTLTGHQDSVYCVAWHPTRTILASGSYDRRIIIWNYTSGEIVETLLGHTGSIWSLDFSPDGTLLASGSSDGSVRVWDIDNLISKYNLTIHNNTVRTVVFNPSGSILASGSYDGNIVFWNMSNGKELSIINTMSTAILTLDSYKNEVVSGDQDNNIKFWDLNNLGSQSRSTINLTSWVRSISLNPRGYVIAAGLDDSDIVIIDRNTSLLVKRLTGHTASVRSVDFDPHGQLLVSSSGDKTVKLWNVTDLDQDGLPDLWEMANGLNPMNSLDRNYDTDLDDLSNIGEYRFGTDPHNPDTDNDIISDGYEYKNGMNGTDPNDAAQDKDNDGMPNLYEYQNDLNASFDDSMYDSDGDGMPNLFEYQNGLLAGSDDAYGDIDNDGMPNIFEYRNGLKITENDADEDPDSDGLSNIQEFIYGTNPNDFDTDNDFFSDGLEKELGTNPRLFFSNPVFTIVSLAAPLCFLALGGFMLYQNRKSIKKMFKKNRKLRIQLRDLMNRKALSIGLLAKSLEISKLDIPSFLKENVNKDALKENAIVLRSDMLLFTPIPPSNASCQICMSEITDKKYFQCRKCQRFVCIEDFLDLKTIGRDTCPNCGGQLIILPFTCPACGLDFSSVTELEHKLGCPLCSYDLPDQEKIIAKVLSRISPSDFVKNLKRNQEKPNKYWSSKPKS